MKKVIQFIYTGTISLKQSELDGFHECLDILKITGASPDTPHDKEDDNSKMQEAWLNGNTFNPNPNVSRRLFSEHFSDSDSQSKEDDPLDSIKPTTKPETALRRPKKRRINKSSGGGKGESKKPKLESSEITDGNNNSELKCIFCHKSFKSSKRRCAHQRECRENSNRRIFHCEILDRFGKTCQFSTTRKCRLQKHQNSTHDVRDVKKDNT